MTECCVLDCDNEAEHSKTANIFNGEHTFPLCDEHYDDKNNW